jgi:DNA-binding response OmpR family regulator
VRTHRARTLLLVEDDEATATFLADNLAADGFDVTVAPGVAEGWRALEVRRLDAVLLDLALVDGSGLVLLDRLRASDGAASRVDPALPVIVLSGRVSELDRVRGFERGADDYICKPFSYPELRGRVAALLRRARERRRGGQLRVGELEVDPSARTARLRGAPVDLSQKEFALLRMLATEPVRVFTKDELLRHIWGYRHMGTTRTLDSHACRLRRKLGVHGDRFVVNVWGVGYRLVDAAAAVPAVAA